MQKVTSLSNDQFKTLVSDKRELKRFMKHPQTEKIEADWVNISEKQLQNIPSGAVYLTQSALGEENRRFYLFLQMKKDKNKLMKVKQHLIF
ncbi:hypothetical protein [Priestia megaterium]|uniref:hypothetical protein n=1 Tax=Priestia megaterium TaxID=1404 RepID=UPI001F12F011|nr:hypothetical protein [Priestia megaterium]UMZ35957.1 hypothetical protein MGJ28_28460 [Priestia megaterium]